MDFSIYKKQRNLGHTITGRSRDHSSFLYLHQESFELLWYAFYQFRGLLYHENLDALCPGALTNPDSNNTFHVHQFSGKTFLSLVYFAQREQGFLAWIGGCAPI